MNRFRFWDSKPIKKKGGTIFTMDEFTRYYRLSIISLRKLLKNVFGVFDLEIQILDQVLC